MSMLVESGYRYVAFFDLLGFRAWLQSAGSREVFTYVRGFLNLMVRSSIPGSIVHPDMSVTVAQSNIGFINFSDSIVFYSFDDSIECFDALITVCGEFMNGVITGPSRMLRGAIAHGEFYADPAVNAYVGQALVDAYELEESQDWLSCSFHRSVTDRDEFRQSCKKYPNFIVRALVPLRGSNEVPYCINWVDKSRFGSFSLKIARGLSDCEIRARRAIANLPAAKAAAELAKLDRRTKHTREFVDFYNK